MNRFQLKRGILAALATAAIIPAGLRAWDKVSPRPAKQISAEQLRENSRKMRARRHGAQVPRLNGVEATPPVFRKGYNSVPNHLTRSADEPRGDYYALVPQFTTMEYATDAYLANVNGATGSLTPLYHGAHYRTGGDVEFQSAAVRGNYIYLPHETSNIIEYYVEWNVVDLSNGNVVNKVNMGGDYLATPYSLTYDEATDMFYGLSFAHDAFNQLVRIDPHTFALEYVGDLSQNRPFLNSISYSPEDGNLYIFDCNNKVYLLDRTRGLLDQAGELSTPDGQILLEEYVAMPMCFSPKDRCFVTAVPDNNLRAFVIQYIDPESWEVQAGEVINDNGTGSYIGALMSANPYASWEAPELPAIPSPDFDKASLSGKVTFSASALRFSGLAFAQGTKLPTTFTIDGNVVFEGEMTPGETRTLDVTLSQGEHKAEVFCMADGEKSPVAQKQFYVGYDNPLPVTYLNLDGLELSWTPPAVGSVHGGYVDRDNITYDIYFNNDKINSRPVTDTSYTIYHPAEMNMTAISVVAVNHDVESERTVLNEIIGKAKELPITIQPTPEDFNIVKVLDDNGDNQTFHYATFKDPAISLFYHQIGYFNDGDEWLFFPRAIFPDASRLYNLTLGIGGVYTGTTREDVDIYIGDKATPQAMKTRIWNREQLGCPHVPVEHSINFAVPEAGEYYIGLHYHSKKELNGRGLTVTNVRITRTDKTSDVPAQPIDCKIVADPAGELKADLIVTLPLLNTLGAPLDTSKDLHVAVESDGLDTEIPVVSGKPGQEVRVKDVTAAKNGFNQFIVTVGNENGYGTSVAYKGYVGLDTACFPDNLKMFTHADNNTVTLSWDTPPAIGVNGGFVDTGVLDYGIYQSSSINLRKIGSTKENSYVLTRPLTSDRQANFHFTVMAENATGYDRNARFVSDILGKPYILPMVEEYATTHFSFSPVLRNTSAGYNDVILENEKEFSAFASILGGNPVVKYGGLYMYSDAGVPTKGQIILPKASTRGVPSVMFSACLWDYLNAPKVIISGRTSDNQDEIVEIGEIPFKRTTSPEWIEEPIELPETFSDKDWIQLYITVEFSRDPNEFMVLDRYSIKPNVDYDLQLHELTGPSSACVGDNMEIDVEIANSGLEANSGSYELAICDPDGNRLAYESAKLPRIISGSTVTMRRNFNLLSEWGEYPYLIVKTSVQGAEDMVEANNDKEIKIMVLDSPLPVVNDLAGAYNDDHTAVSLTWSEPDLSHGDSEDIENTLPFEPAERIGLFRNVDQDRSVPFMIEGLTWPHAEEPQAWTVMNAKQLNLMNDPRLYPHSGEQYLLARSLHYDFQGGEEAKQASDWLISPEVVPGSELTFWYNRVSTEYTEYVELWVSSTDDVLGDEIVTSPSGQRLTCGSFRKVRSFSKTGSETWEEVTVTLPDDAKYFALVYCSYDELGAMIDDIQFTPVQLAKWEVDHYSVFRHVTKDGKTVVEDLDNNVKGTSLTKEVEDANANYYVRTFVKTPVGVKYGPLSNQLRLYAMGVDDLTDLQGVYGTEGAIIVKGHAGEKFALYTADGKYLRRLTLTEANQTVAAEPGIYIVKAGNAMVKVLVK